MTDNALTDDFTDHAIDDLLAVRDRLGMSILAVRYLRGTLNRVSVESTAWAHRGAEVFIFSAAFLPPHAPESAQQHVYDLWAAMAPHTSGIYGNFLSVTSEQVVELMYPLATRDRLRAVKQRYDPKNLFRRNHNVLP